MKDEKHAGRLSGAPDPQRLVEMDPILGFFVRRWDVRPWMLAAVAFGVFTGGQILLNALQGTLLPGRTPVPFLHRDWIHLVTALPVLTPIFAGLLLSAYYRADTVHAELRARGVLSLRSATEDADAPMRRIVKRLRPRWIDAACLLTCGGAGVIWFRMLQRQSGSNWQHVHAGSVTPAAVYQIFTTCLAAFIVLRAIIAAAVFLLETRRLFSDKGEYVLRLRALHPDGCGGMQPVADFVFRLSMLLCVVGLMLASFVIAGVFRHKGVAEAMATVGPPVLLGCYTFVAPVLFFLPLWPVHGAMRRSKEAVLDELSHAYDAQFMAAHKQLRNGELEEETTAALERIHTLYRRAAAMPVWPFSPGILLRFTLTVVLPLAIPLITQILDILF